MYQRAVLAASLLALTSIANAQSLPASTPITAVDVNGVDLVSGTTSFKVADAGIGSGEWALKHVLQSFPNGFAGYSAYPDNFRGGLGEDLGQGGTYVVAMGDEMERFALSGGVFTSKEGRGSTLVNNGNGTYTYTRHDGVVVTISSEFSTYLIKWSSSGSITRIQYPDGRVRQIHYKKAGPNNTVRVQSVTQSNGLQIKYRYAVNGIPAANDVGWSRPAGVTAINNAVEYCDPLADTCSLTGAWPASTYVWSTPASGVGSILTVTDQGGGQTRYTMDQYGRVVGLKPATSAVDLVTYSYCSRNYPWTCFYRDSAGNEVVVMDKVITSTREGQPWTYWFSVVPISGQYSLYRSQGPLGPEKQVMIGLTTASPLVYILSEDGTKVNFENTHPTNRITRITYPETNETVFGYDGRSNITSTTKIAKPASGPLANLVESFGFDPTCTNLVTCNKPNWSKDARQNQTFYTYDPVHGGLLTRTSPAVDGIQPQERFIYTQRRAWVRNSTGTYDASALMWVLHQKSFCRKGAPNASGVGCAAAADEVLTTYDYGADSGPNNLFLKGVAVTGDGETRRTCYTNDARGNRTSETTPRAGLTSCP